MCRVIASIEARMGASRLPGKVLADIGGRPALSRLTARLRRCETLDGIVIATSTNAQDDPIAAWAKCAGLPCHRGSEIDVLSRVAEAQRMMQGDVVVEVWGDMVLLDPEVIDLGVSMYRANACDVVTTTVRPSFPAGVDAMVFARSDLEWVEENVQSPEMREHVSLYFLKNPQSYRVLHLLAPKCLRKPEWRLLLDYPEDLLFIQEIYARLEPRFGDDFGLLEMADLLAQEPALLQINRCRQEMVGEETVAKQEP